ncbi:barren [Neoconidiobolus thromboides FSU 785]|nr:barren [Neoconidiobolus thromboides FSU 785]
MGYGNKSFSSVVTRREGEELAESPASKTSKLYNNSSSKFSDHDISLAVSNTDDRYEKNNRLLHDTSQELSFVLSNNDDENEKRNRRKQALEFKKEKNKRPILLPQAHKNKQNEVNSANEAPLPVFTNLSPEEINKRYEQWMKIAADNKINTTNTWNFELIDYFSKINYFKDGNSINFQKASCTLDGCVKIYTSRVDSVASETGILLNGLAESTAKRIKQIEQELEGGNETGKKKTAKSEQTLVKDFSSINVKSFDSEFSVDPLFRKTCADFDEGGARGLLLNHLSIQGDGRLIFDASDCLTEGPELKVEILQPSNEKKLLCLSGLFGQEFDDENLVSKDICPDLKNFDYNSHTALELPNYDDYPENSDGEIENEEQDSFFMEQNELFHDITMMTFAKQNGAFDEEELVTDDKIKEENQEEEIEKPGITLLAESDNIYSYFDQRVMKNWAGPEHWRLKREAKTNKEPITQEKKPKTEKVEFEFNFQEHVDPINIDDFFDSGKGSTLSRKLYDKNSGLNTLPEDLQLNSKTFFSLFTKPTFTLKPKKLIDNKSSGNESYIVIPEDNGNHINIDGYEDHSTPGPMMDFGSEHPTEIEDHNILDGLQGRDDSFASLNEELRDEANLNIGAQTLPELKRIQALKIDYARTAKRVDVKLLKDNIWKIINDEGPIDTKGILDKINEDKDEILDTISKPINSLAFSKVVKDLPLAYPKKKAKDLSVPFCFICLLHLANEHNLEIEADSDMKELIIKKEEVKEEEEEGEEEYME